MPKSPSPARLLPRLRIMHGREFALGPGKASLLAAIAELGSIRLAAQRLGMSYMRAWTLIRTMNGCFKKPLVESVRGGKQGGGARLTETGHTALRLYQKMETDCLTAVADDWSALQKILAK